ncbi:hypothetical protein [Sporosarcina jiandibaonis]|uniref:hypothetical protein n=1 Tax=Sporosarcina jiandibaonis TaxID=2715535 RepID=UPI001557DB7D|nr:hypothetical protein [Sporosarcina jiandibaonis]
MGKLSEESFSAIKGELIDGRLTMSGMRSYLIGLFFMSALFVGVSLAVANANTVGWHTLSTGWHRIYYAEAVLFGIHLLVLLLCWWNNAFSQKLLSVGMVVFTYKAALDPYLTVLMFSKDEGNYHLYLPITLIILASGLILHIVVLDKWINSLRPKTGNGRKSNVKKDSKHLILFPVILLLTALTTLVIKNGILGDYELVFVVFIMTVMYLGLLIGACEFIIAMYCIFRYPSFSVKNFNIK